MLLYRGIIVKSSDELNDNILQKIKNFMTSFNINNDYVNIVFTPASNDFLIVVNNVRMICEYINKLNQQPDEIEFVYRFLYTILDKNNEDLSLEDNVLCIKSINLKFDIQIKSVETITSDTMGMYKALSLIPILKNYFSKIDNRYAVKMSLKSSGLEKQDYFIKENDICSDLSEEFKRISDSSNPKYYVGIPCVYILEGDYNFHRVASILLCNYLYKHKRVTTPFLLDYLFGSGDLVAYEGNTITFNVNIDDSQFTSVMQLNHKPNCDFGEVIDSYYGNSYCHTQIILDSDSESKTSNFASELNSRGINFVIIRDDFINVHNAKELIKEQLKILDPNNYENLIKPCEEAIIKTKLDQSKCNLIVKIKNWYDNNKMSILFPLYNKIDNKCIKVIDDTKNSFEFLNELIGLKNIKETIRNIIYTEKFSKYLNSNVSFSGCSNSMIFTGNPGTCKTTIARILGSILYENEILFSRQFIFAGRSDLVGKFVGWTAQQTTELFEKARGGILFIDEAYSLCDDSFGKEAIDTLVNLMDNHTDTMVIFAGYPKPMKDMLNINPGLRSRINYYIDFPDYDLNELLDILKLMAKRRKLKITKAGLQTATDIIKKYIHQENFGNGRFIRNLLDKVCQRHALRIMDHVDELSDRQIRTLTKDDFTNIDMSDIKINNNHIGF